MSVTSIAAKPDLNNGVRCDRLTRTGPGLTQVPARIVPGPMTILLVEDDAATNHAVAQMLGALGHEVLTAVDGVEAIELLEKHYVHVVLADWVMPWMDGLELCRRIRGRDGQPYTYIILFTGRRGGGDDRLEALDAGADGFLAKPLSNRELVASLEIGRRVLAMQSELKRKNDALLVLATTDELTGLKNRRSFFEALEYHFALAARQWLPLSVVLLDVDHFKSYNDAYGHPAGDDVLRGIGEGLRSKTRAEDTVARHGGEEFAILLPATGSVVALAMAQRLRATIECWDWPHPGVTASFGVASMTRDTGKAVDLVEQADLALYASKDRGRNCVTQFSDLDGQPEILGAPANDSGGRPSPLSRLVRPNPLLEAPPACDDIVESWMRAMELRGIETVAASRHVTAVMLEFARAIGIDEVEMLHIRRGSQLHDIGMIGISDTVLNKPGPLSQEELRIVRRHPDYAVELLAPFEFLFPSLEIPYCHHERWDGTGYPRGLKGENIPLAARAFAAVDIWDALSRDRPFRKAWPEEEVRTHINMLAGSHLDPDMVATLVRLQSGLKQMRVEMVVPGLTSA